LTPAERVKKLPLLEKKGFSERESCELLSICRSRLFYQPRPNVEREQLTQIIREEALKHPTYGYRRIAWRLRQKRGIAVYDSRVYRLWHKAGLSLKRGKKKRKRVGNGEQPPPRALYPNHVWTYDFVKLRLRNGSYVRILVLLDEFTRECLGFFIARSIPASKVLSFLQAVMAERGAVPEYLRSDNGPEFIEAALNAWLKEQGVRPTFITPGSPWENGKCESFNGKFREEFLDRNVHFSLRMLEIQAEWWRTYYNQERPHSALNYQTPSEFAQAWYNQQKETQETQKKPTMNVPSQDVTKILAKTATFEDTLLGTDQTTRPQILQTNLV
jgi:putative transposase